MLQHDRNSRTEASPTEIFAAGCVGGFVSSVFATPVELLRCRAQVGIMAVSYLRRIKQYKQHIIAYYNNMHILLHVIVPTTHQQAH